MSQPQQPRRPISPWPIGAAILSTFVALAILLRDSTLAVQTMIAAALLFALLLMRNTKKNQGAGSTEAAVPTAAPSRSPPWVSASAMATLQVADLPAVMTLKQAADYLQSDLPAVKAELEAGRLPGNKLGDEWRIRTVALNAWLDGAYGWATVHSSSQ